MFAHAIFSVGGLRPNHARDKLAFSRKFNEVVLGFGSDRIKEVVKIENPSMIKPDVILSHSIRQKDSSSDLEIGHHSKKNSNAAMYSSGIDFEGNEDHAAAAASSQSTQLCSQGKEIFAATQRTQINRFTLSIDENRWLVQRLNISAIRPLQLTAFELLVNAAEFDTKLIQGPTSMGKDMLPFMMAVTTRKAQIMFVPFVALFENALIEGQKYGCNVVKFSDIGKSITIETAAATADIIVCSYEHAKRAVRVVQELSTRQRLGQLLINI